MLSRSRIQFQAIERKSYKHWLFWEPEKALKADLSPDYSSTSRQDSPEQSVQSQRASESHCKLYPYNSASSSTSFTMFFNSVGAIALLQLLSAGLSLAHPASSSKSPRAFNGPSKIFILRHYQFILIFHYRSCNKRLYCTGHYCSHLR